MDINDIIIKFKKESINLDESTLRGYGNIAQRFFNYINKCISQIDTTDILCWYSYRYNSGCSGRTVQQDYIALRSVFNYFVEERLIDVNPFKLARIPTYKNKLPYVMDKKDLFLIKEAAKNDTRDSAIIETLYCTGVRNFELTNICRDNINWRERKIDIIEGKDLIDREVLFSLECEHKLQVYLQTRSDESPYLFINKNKGKLSTRRLREIVKKYVAIANLSPMITPKTFRHTFATELSQKGCPDEYIAKLLGHTTNKYVKIYAHLLIEADD